MVYEVTHYIGHALITAADSARHAVITNPATGMIIGRVALANQDACNLALETAKNAWLGWSTTPAAKRAQILFEFRRLLDASRNELACIITKEHGKSLEDARGSISRAVEVVEFYCSLLSQLRGTMTSDVATGMDCYTLQQPLGVCLGIAPFNFPVMVPIWLMIPAIACGNTFIIKPSEQDPTAAVYLCELLRKAGLPSGVANCVHGDKTTVDYLVSHPDIQAVAAVASTATAAHIYKTAAMHSKRVATFGGAKNHCVVMPDAVFDQTVRAIVGAAYGSAGERCMAISVVVTVGELAATRLLAEMLPLINAIRVEPGDVADCDMGPLISSAHRQRVLTEIDSGVASGAVLLIDGRSFQHPNNPQGFFIGPSLFDHVIETMSIYQNEIFGPVLCIVRLADLAQAISLINRNQYGNGAVIFTSDGYNARKFSQEVTAGMIGINVPVPVPVVSHPFGGWKHSSFGDTNMHGMESIHFYMRRKTVTTRWPQKDSGIMQFTMPTND